MIQDYTTKYCIIGAGASGITAAKNLKAMGIACDVLEREDEVGGNWIFGKPHSSVYKSTHLISSKKMSAYTDYPMPKDFPDYPNHVQVLRYLRDYARHFGIYDLIRFNTTVTHIERDEAGGWLVSLEDDETRHYRGLIVANGHHWDPKYPDFPGTFDGLILHAAEYKTPDVFRDKRVLVVGAGNSGCDIAVDAAPNAAKVFHSTRRGYYYIPKYIFGYPTDVVNETALKLRPPMFLRRPTQRLLIRMALGSPTRYGLPKPDHKVLESHPLVNSQIYYYIGHGDITPKPNVQSLQGQKVAFVDGSSEDIDVIVYATGYKISFPFLDAKHLNMQDSSQPHLFLHIFHPDYDNLFVAGLIQPDSGQFWLVDYQCQLIAHFIQAQEKAPRKAAAFRAIKAGAQPDIRGGRKLQTERHFLEVDHFRYKQELLKLLRHFR